MTTLPPDFTIKTERASDGSSSVVVAGEVDVYRVPELAQALQTAALLIQEHRQLAANGCELIVLVGEQTPTTAFGITGTDRMLTIHHVSGGTNPRISKHVPRRKVHGAAN